MKALNKKIKDQEAEKEVITYYLHPLDQTLKINNRLIKYIGVSSHCDKHLKHGITRESIIKLVKLLNDGYFDFDGPQSAKKNYFKDYPELSNKKYKLVWWWWKELDSYLWVRTCYPVKK